MQIEVLSFREIQTHRVKHTHPRLFRLSLLLRTAILPTPALQYGKNRPPGLLATFLLPPFRHRQALPNRIQTRESDPGGPGRKALYFYASDRSTTCIRT